MELRHVRGTMTNVGKCSLFHMALIKYNNIEKQSRLENFSVLSG